MRNKKKIIIFIIISVIIVGFGTTYSIFNSSANFSIADQKIAGFVFNAQSVDSLDIPIIDLKPGDEKEYAFSVSNNKDGYVSEVSVNYQITIKTYHFVPLVIKLYKDVGNEEEFVFECDEDFSRNLNNELICNGPTEEMNYTDENLDNYFLKVLFPEEYNDVSYSNLVDFINLEIKSWQKTEEE